MDSEEQRIVNVAKSICNALCDQINEDDRIGNAYEALTALHLAASFISDQYTNGLYHFTLAPKRVAPFFMKLAMEDIHERNVDSKNIAQGAIEKAMEKDDGRNTKDIDNV